MYRCIYLCGSQLNRTSRCGPAGFADIPSGPSCPYIVRRGLLGTVVSVSHKDLDQETDWSLATGNVHKSSITAFLYWRLATQNWAVLVRSWLCWPFPLLKFVDYWLLWNRCGSQLHDEEKVEKHCSNVTLNHESTETFIQNSSLWSMMFWTPEDQISNVESVWRFDFVCLQLSGRWRLSLRNSENTAALGEDTSAATSQMLTSSLFAVESLLFVYESSRFSDNGSDDRYC